MTLAETMQELESLGTEQNRKVYRRHGAGPNLYGVSWAHLGKLKKKLKINHPLAVELWDSGNYDARILATLIADPAQLTSTVLEEWVKQIDCYTLASAFAKLTAASPLASAKASKWSKSKTEWTAASGWDTAGALAVSKNGDDAEFVALLPIIEGSIHAAKNRVRHSMNSALIAIGSRNPKLRRAAIATAKRIGKVDVDHGETGCQTPDAVAYINKVAARAK